MSGSQSRRWVMAGAIARRLVVFAALWWMLIEGDASQWSYAIVLVPLAVAVSLLVLPPVSPAPRPLRRMVALVRLTGWFGWRSVIGGIDVARRALGPREWVQPQFVRCDLRIGAGASRIAVVNLMNLMPGSLSVRIGESALDVHVLHPDIEVSQTVAQLERRVAAVTGARLDSSSPPDDSDLG